MSIGQRIRDKRHERGLTMEELASKVGTTKQAVYKYEKSLITNVPSDKIEAFAVALQTTPAYLMGWTDVDSDYIRNRKIPILGTIAAGSPITAEENIIGYTYTDNHRISYALKVKGDSMIGSRIFDGDIVYVQSDVDYENGDIVVALVNGDEATVKKYYQYGHEIVLVPTNPTMAEMRFPAEDVKLIGKVVGVSFDL